MPHSTGEADRKVTGMTFTPKPDEGQAGLVLLPDGRYGFRYPESDDVIIMKKPEEYVPPED